MLLILTLVVFALGIALICWILFHRRTPSVRTVMRRMDRGEHPFTEEEVQAAILRRFGGRIVDTRAVSEEERQEELRRAIADRLTPHQKQ